MVNTVKVVKWRKGREEIKRNRQEGRRRKGEGEGEWMREEYRW